MLYIHIPYCHQKCTYCAFYSTPSHKGREEYAEAVCRELELRKEELQHPIKTLYLGGGTPTLLDCGQLEMIAQKIKSLFDISQLKEASIEANPEDLDPERLKKLADMQLFNRLSIGVQSFHDSQLRLLNRRHTGQDAIKAVENAHEAGFRNISIDLIYGQPGQDLSDWQEDLYCLAQLGSRVTHLSCYALMLEPGTILHRQIASGRLQLPDEDQVLQEYHILQDWCKTHGFKQYEISSYCRDGFHSRHNSRYWNRTPYTGIGAAAHSFDGKMRRWNVADIQRYMLSVSNGDTEYGSEMLSPEDAFNEYIMTSLRTTAGIDLQMLQREWPQHTDILQNKIKKFVENGLLTLCDNHIKPTYEGLLHADGMAAELFI